MSQIENRKHERRDVSLHGMLMVGEAADAPAVACEIVNLSAGSAKVKLAEPVGHPAVVVLEIAPGGKYAADVIWKSPLSPASSSVPAPRPWPRCSTPSLRSADEGRPRRISPYAKNRDVPSVFPHRSRVNASRAGIVALSAWPIRSIIPAVGGGQHGSAKERGATRRTTSQWEEPWKPAIVVVAA